MPHVKHFYDRIEILHQCLQSLKLSFNELLKEVNYRLASNYGFDSQISIKTLRDDLKYMREECDAPIPLNSRTYFYSNKNYDYKDRLLHLGDIDNIKKAAAMLRQIKGFDVDTELLEICNKLELRSANETIEGYPKVIFGFKNGVAGLENLEDILSCINAKTVISFKYKPFSTGNIEEVILHPYLLKEFNSRWYVIGLNDQHRKIYNYALDRIISKIKNSDGIKYQNETQFNPEEYYKHVIGVTVPQDAIKQMVELRFSLHRSNYIQTAPLHPSQERIKETKSNVTFRYLLIPNNELIALILSFGNDVEVLKPLALKDTITEILKKANLNYK